MHRVPAKHTCFRFTSILVIASKPERDSSYACVIVDQCNIDFKQTQTQLGKVN